jgi:GntR family transcriptional regulator
VNTTTDLIGTLKQDLADTATSAPLYHQLRKRMRHAIESGLLQVGDALPSERELAEVLGLSRVTVRKAISGLVTEGLLTQQQGAGTFVAPRVEQALSLLTSFSEDMRARGMIPGARWIDCGTGLANPEEALALALSPGAKVSRLQRLRTANDKPMTLEQTTMPREFLPDPGVIGDSLYDHLIETGCRPVRALQLLRAFAVEEEEDAELLALPLGSPVLYIERRAFLESGQVVEFTRSLYRGDSYDFVVELRLANGRTES